MHLHDLLHVFNFFLTLAFAVALGNLYHDDLDVELENVSSVLAAASALGYKGLMEA